MVVWFRSPFSLEEKVIEVFFLDSLESRQPEVGNESETRVKTPVPYYNTRYVEGSSESNPT